jgi:hypothetical protein
VRVTSLLTGPQARWISRGIGPPLPGILPITDKAEAEAAMAARLQGRLGTVRGVPYGKGGTRQYQVELDEGEIVYFARSELAPAPEAYLVELPRPFSTAPTSQLVAAGGLGAANLAGVLYLGTLLQSARAVGGAAGSAALLASLRSIYPGLLLYALGFVLLPIGRSVRLKRQNDKVGKRGTG